MEKGLLGGPGGAGANPSQTLLTIGWREYVEFPDWGVRRLKAKIDTGARTSALDVIDYKLRETDGGVWVAELRLALHRKDRTRLKVVRAPVLETVFVRNSSGGREKRPVVETTVRLGPVVKRVGVTLTNRARMRFRMLLGRKALEGSFLVDVSQQYLLKSEARPR
jgi:hypothetical protein